MGGSVSERKSAAAFDLNTWKTFDRKTAHTNSIFFVFWNLMAAKLRKNTHTLIAFFYSGRSLNNQKLRIFRKVIAR